MTTKKPFFSIILPVYNGADFLSNMVTNIKKQSYDDWELIIVDDGSTDNTHEVFKKITNEERDPIKYISYGENRGPSAARNYGMKYARGEYISFLDVDDRITSDYYEKIANKIYENNVVDIVLYGIVEEYYNGKRKPKQKVIAVDDCLYLNGEFHKKTFLFINNTLLRYTCNKVYRKAFICENNLQYKKINSGEDMLFNLKTFGKAKSILTISNVYYYYRKDNLQSITNRYIDNYYDIHMEIIREEIEYAKKNRVLDMARDVIYKEYIKHIMIALEMTFKDEAKKGEREYILKSIDYGNLKFFSRNDLKLGIKYNWLSKIIKSRNKLLLIFCAYVIYILKNRARFLWGMIK